MKQRERLAAGLAFALSGLFLGFWLALLLLIVWPPGGRGFTFGVTMAAATVAGFVVGYVLGRPPGRVLDSILDALPPPW